MRLSIYKVTLVMMLASMLLIGKGRRVEAEEQAPDLRMLLNLDLFGTQPTDGSADAEDPGTAPSMLDQIRALNAMGDLGGAPGDQPPATSTGASGAPEAPTERPWQDPSQNPSNVTEVPQL